MWNRVTVIKGDIFQSRAQTLVNTVNCVGIMGKGLALEFKNRFPGMYKDYVRRCKKGQVSLGEPYLFSQLEPPNILNFPTKGHWRSVSRLDDIIQGLRYLEKHYKDWGITSIAVPSLGCQLGQLDWRVVLPLLYEHLSRLEIPAELYIPSSVTIDQALSVMGLAEAPVSIDSPVHVPPMHPEKLSSAWVALVAILEMIEREQYHYPVGRTRFQKLAYFATAQGIPTGLTYRRSSFGPFAEELKGNVLTRLINGDLIREEQVGRMFVLRTGAAYRDILPKVQEDLNKWRPAMEKVADLLLRTSTIQSEIAATVHFAAGDVRELKDATPTEREVLEAVMKWKQRRKPPLDEKDAAVAIRNLAALGWIDVLPSTDLPLQSDPIYEAMICE
ncbi:MAG: macro domain-containing protein [Methanothrix sp.]|nr:macro domain-containing protein [Methanothrix sp.]